MQGERSATKRCCQCGEIKPLAEFWIDRSKKDGHFGACAACLTEKKRIRRRAEGQQQHCTDRWIEGRHYEVDPVTDCWIWTRNRDRRGYPLGKRAGRYAGAHRTAYEDAFGEIPAGFDVHHRCQRPPCVNPAHLEALAPAEHRKRHPVKPWGHPAPRMADGREDEIRELRHGGMTYRQIADRVGVSFWAVRSVLDPRLERSAA
jgi:hypothetical protein